MASFNKVIFVGRLTRDPDTQKSREKGTVYTKFSLAVDRGYGDNKQVDFWNVVTWNKLAETCATYLTKGSLVLLEGEMTSRKYTGKDGTEKTAIELNARSMQMLDSRNKSNSAPAPQQKGTDTVEEFDADEMPF